MASPETNSEPEAEPESETAAEPEDEPSAVAEITDEARLYLWICLYSACILLIVIGNTAIIYAMLRRKLLRSRPVNYFLFSLIVARASIGLLVVPARLLGLFSEEYLGSILCKLCHYAGHTSTVTSILSTSMVAVTKYIDIVKHEGTLRFTTRQGSLGVVAVWIAGALYAIRAPIFYDLIAMKSEDGSTLYSCRISPSFADVNIVFVYVDLVILFALPFAVIAFCYSGTIKGLRRMAADSMDSKVPAEDTENDEKPKLRVSPPPVEIRPVWEDEEQQRKKSPFKAAQKMAANPEAESDAEIRKASLRSIKMILIVATLFVICTFIPYPFKIYTYYHEVSEAFNVAERWVYFLSYCNAWLNVIVILYFRKDIRDGMRCRSARVDSGTELKENTAPKAQSMENIVDQMVVNIG